MQAAAASFFPTLEKCYSSNDLYSCWEDSRTRDLLPSEHTLDKVLVLVFWGQLYLIFDLVS